MATAFHEPMMRSPVDLGSLNDGERRVLRLLAEGHTAKSIANVTGSTAAAVNERLREARRKTGAGSSRELARLLRAQENGDKLIGVGKLGSPRETASNEGAELWRPQTGVFAMIALFLAVAAAGAALMSQAAPLNNDVDPIVGQPIERFPQPADLHARLRAEARDPAWAPRMESSIGARLMSMPLVGKDGNVLRVTCATTLCEIAGSLVAPDTKAALEDQNSQFARTVRDLQVPPLTDDLMHLDLKVESASFTSGKGKPDRTVFLIYYSRAQQRQ